MTAAHPRSLSLTLVVETDDGIFVREVADALPLAAGVERGPAAEEATRSAVARWGLPDFVFRPLLRQVGSGVRELGDVVLVHSGCGVVVQVKSRDTAGGMDPGRESAWLTKAIETATRQASGTVRSICRSAARLRNLRGRELTIDGDSLEWAAVVVLDHPSVPHSYTPTWPMTRIPTVVLLRRDWEFLFAQLRSTHAVIGYIQRVFREDPIPLGDEPVRYYELAQADAEAEPENLDPMLLGGEVQHSVPLLPRAPAGVDDTRSDLLVRIILEDIATSLFDDPVEEWRRLEVLSAIDSLPVGARSELGQFLLECLREVAIVEEGSIKWRMRRIRNSKVDSPYLLFGACTKFSDLTREAFRQWVLLRHHERSPNLHSREELTTVGVMLTPRRDGSRPWDTTMFAITGQLNLTDEEVRAIRRMWGRNEPS